MLGSDSLPPRLRARHNINALGEMLGHMLAQQAGKGADGAARWAMWGNGGDELAGDVGLDQLTALDAFGLHPAFDAGVGDNGVTEP